MIGLAKELAGLVRDLIATGRDPKVEIRRIRRELSNAQQAEREVDDLRKYASDKFRKDSN